MPERERKSGKKSDEKGAGEEKGKVSAKARHYSSATVHGSTAYMSELGCKFKGVTQLIALLKLFRL